MNSLSYIFVYFVSFLGYSTTPDLETIIFNAIKNSETKALSNYFTSSVKVSINRDEQISSKFQAERIISDYLKSNKILDVKRTPSLEDGSTSCIIITAKVNNKSVRFILKIVKLKDAEFISEFRVE